ncbi:hypothetical protein [Erwinia phage Pecta]|nr:hypothetical protein [Erwinia phage Pecta]
MFKLYKCRDHYLLSDGLGFLYMKNTSTGNWIRTWIRDTDLTVFTLIANNYREIY